MHTGHSWLHFENIVFGTACGAQIVNRNFLFLSDPVDATDTLLNLYWIPRKIIVNHLVPELPLDKLIIRGQKVDYKTSFITKTGVNGK